jgi:hypothetical protein
VNSSAVVYVDGKKSGGEVHFPTGEVDLAAACRPGGKHVLNLRVTAFCAAAWTCEHHPSRRTS